MIAFIHKATMDSSWHLLTYDDWKVNQSIYWK